MPTPILILSPLNFYHFTKYLLFLDAPVVEDLFRTLSAMDVIVGRKPMSILLCANCFTAMVVDF